MELCYFLIEIDFKLFRHNTTSVEEEKVFDKIIKNGRVLDPLTGRDEVTDIGIRGKRIAKVGKINETCRQMIDASGCYVVPGLNDFHVHCAFGMCAYGMPPDALLSSGVTSTVDGGTTGIANYEAFYRNVVCNSLVDIKTFLLVSSSGQISGRVTENMNPALFEEDAIIELCEKYPHNIIGLKIRMEKKIVGEYGLEPLKRAVEIAEKVHLPISVHASDTPGEVKDTLDLLRPGDIFCHVFHQMGKTIMGADGKILPEVWEAQKRGVLFEIGHGSLRFSGPICKAALEQGFMPDLISSDLGLLSMNIAPTYSFAYILSELLNLGMDFPTIVDLCTRAPARITDPGRKCFLEEGQPADIAVFRIVDHPHHYIDTYKNEFDGSKMVKPEMTIKDGLIVHRQWDFLNME